MSFEQSVKIPLDRIGALVGRNGKVKSDIEERCGVGLSVDSSTGEVLIKSRTPILEMQPFKAVEVATAIAKGFSPQRAFRLLDEDFALDIIDLREYVGKSENALKRIKGRIIGLGGKSRKIIEELTDASISVYGHTVAIIGRIEDVRQAKDAVEMLTSGSPHQSVYKKLQRVRTRGKLDRLQLWEGEPIG